MRELPILPLSTYLLILSCKKNRFRKIYSICNYNLVLYYFFAQIVSVLRIESSFSLLLYAINIQQ